MYWRDVATLVAITKEPDDDGYKAEHKELTEVFVDVQSVKRSEFYAARQSGIKIDLVFLVRAVDYSGEERVEFDGKTYAVVRAYTKAGEIYELNCSEIPDLEAEEAHYSDALAALSEKDQFAGEEAEE